MAIRKPLIVGMGRVGSLTALLLTELGMQVAGVGMETLSSMPTNIDYTSADITDPHILADLCHGKDAVIACLPYHLILELPRWRIPSASTILISRRMSLRPTLSGGWPPRQARS